MIAFPRYYTLILIFDFRLIRSELPQNHDDRLQNVERLEARNGYWLVFVRGYPFVGAATNYGGYAASEGFVGTVVEVPIDATVIFTSITARSTGYFGKCSVI